MTKVLVSGGTGFIGSAIVRELKSRGAEVAVLGRDADKIQRLFGEGVEAREADVRDAGRLREALAGAEVVVNAVQFPTSPIEQPRKGWTFEEIDLRGTEHQVDAAKAAGARRFVYLSGVGAAAEAEKRWFRYKWEAEQYLEGSGLEWVVIRPTWVYGRSDNSLNRLLGFTRWLPFVPMFGDGKQAMQPVYIRDVGWLAAEAAMRPEVTSGVFEIGGPEVMTMNDVLKAGLQAMGKKRPILHQPVAVGKLMGRLASVLPSAPLTPDAVDFITEPAVADNTAVEQVFKPQLTPLKDGLASYLRRPRQED